MESIGVHFGFAQLLIKSRVRSQHSFLQHFAPHVDISEHFVCDFLACLLNIACNSSTTYTDALSFEKLLYGSFPQ